MFDAVFSITASAERLGNLLPVSGYGAEKSNIRPMKTKQTFLVRRTINCGAAPYGLFGRISLSVLFGRGYLLRGGLAGALDCKEQWTFEKKTKKPINSLTPAEKKYVMDAHLFRIKNEHFLDLFNPNGRDDIMPPPVPTHLLIRVFQLAPTLRMAALDYEWLSNLTEKDPATVRHHLVVTDEKAQNAQIVLTADTPGLQKFIGNNLKTEDAWKDPFELKRD
jgi:hypothetical protein